MHAIPANVNSTSATMCSTLISSFSLPLVEIYSSVSENLTHTFSSNHSQNQDGVDMKIYRIYRVHDQTSRMEFVGKLVERRKGERFNNAADILRWAEKVFGKPLDARLVANTGNAPPWDSLRRR